MINLFWRLVSKLLARTAVADWLIAGAQRTLYLHIISADSADLYKALGFPADYIISYSADGKPFTKTQQVHMCGNSVSPPPMAALARANAPWRMAEREAVAA